MRLNAKSKNGILKSNKVTNKNNNHNKISGINFNYELLKRLANIPRIRIEYKEFKCYFGGESYYSYRTELGYIKRVNLTSISLDWVHNIKFENIISIEVVSDTHDSNSLQAFL